MYVGDRVKFFSLPAQVIHNLVPVPTEMLKAKTTSCLKLPFCHLSFIELPLPLSFSYGTCQTVPCIFNAYELHLCYIAPEGVCVMHLSPAGLSPHGISITASMALM